MHIQVGDRVQVRGHKRTAIVKRTFTASDPSRYGLAELDRTLRAWRIASNTWRVEDLVKCSSEASDA